jgi:hypothetical protein
MRIDSSGNVGIGITNPDVPLNVLCNSSADGLTLRGRSSDNISRITFKDNANSSTYGRLDVRSDLFIVNAVANIPLLFNTNDTERMRIDSSGNCGIGTSSPTDRLHIVTNGTSVYNVFKASNANSTAVMVVGVGGSAVGATSLQNNAYLWNLGNSALSFGTNDTERMRIDSSGSVLIGTTSQVGFGKFCVLADSSAVNQVALQDSGTTYATNIGYINFTNSTGGQAGFIAHTTATTVAYLTTSDARLKENIVDAPSALSAIKNVKVRSYNWKEGKEKVTYGFVAQELYTEIPEVVGKGDDKAILENSGDVWQLEYGRLTPILFKAIQEQQAMIETLTTRLNALEGK